MLYLCHPMLTDKDYHITNATIWYLEMHNPPADILPAKEGVTCSLLPKPVAAETYRRYYRAVGLKWNWLDRLSISDAALTEKINTNNTDIYVIQVHGADAGYAEFSREERFVEIVYFGLVPAYTGKGYGKWFLNWVIHTAWSYQPEWIQLNTCSLDHPNALPVYLSAGFTIVRTTVEARKMLNDQ